MWPAGVTLVIQDAKERPMPLLWLNAVQHEPTRTNSNAPISWIFAGFVVFSCTTSAPELPYTIRMCSTDELRAYGVSVGVLTVADMIPLICKEEFGS